jgi:type I restriction enzyme, S subunit
MNNITRDGRADFGLLRRVPLEIARKADRWLKEGDVLFCNTNSTELVGKACIFSGWDEPCTYSNHLTCLRTNPEAVLPGWLFMAIRHLWLSGFFAANCKEFVGQSAYNQNKLRELRVPVPPLTEQRRIVARAEELDIAIRHAIRLHREASRSTARLFQVALESAFSDRETADWPVYNASRLFSAVSGQVDPRDPAFANMPHVGPDSIESGTTRLLADKIQTARALGLKSGKYAFGPAHVLYSKIRPGLRKVAIPNFAGVCSADIYALLPNSAIITREFLALSLVAPAFTEYAVSKSDRNAIPKINQKALFAFTIPVPGRDTQEHIVAELFDLQARAAELAADQRAIAAELDLVVPAMLSKAFHGDLVPTEAELARLEGRNYQTAEESVARARAHAATKEPKLKCKPSRRERSMAELTEDTVKVSIGQIGRETFSFDELREKVSGEYDAVKDIVFSLLAKRDSGLSQVFDQQAKAMRFRWRPQ